jgi:type II secretory pathway pseudopilin PulG
MRPSNAGTTLVEVLLAIVLFGFVTYMMGWAVSTGYAAQARASQRLFTLGATAQALDLLNRELRVCQKMYLPDPATSFAEGQIFVPQKGLTSPLIFAHYSSAAASNIVVAWQVDYSTTDGGGRPAPTLQRFLYEADFDPADPAQQNLAGPVKPLLVGASGLSVHHEYAAQFFGHLFVATRLGWQDPLTGASTVYEDEVQVPSL